MLTDFFIANLNEVSSINAYTDIEKFQILHAKRIDTIKLETLDELLTSDSVDYGERLVKHFNDYEVLVFSIRNELVHALIETDSNQLEIIAEKWSETEEWILDKGTKNDLAKFLKELKQLATQAKNDEKNIFLINSM